MKQSIIQPRVLKGFRDILPEDANLRESLFGEMRKIFKSFGMNAIDTPALEYSEIILGKGSEETDKQLFRFEDQGGRDVALRFDLTVPLARFTATHIGTLGTPFKRYHIAPVWRAEKPQRGRYREFYQCDFDVIGSKSIAADCEILLIAATVLDKIGMSFTIRFNHRGVLNALIESFLKGKEEEATQVLRSIDKLDKFGKESVLKELIEKTSLNETSANECLGLLLELREEKEVEKVISLLENKATLSKAGTSALEEVKELWAVLRENTFSKGSFTLDLSIARGLDYYTGLVFETNLNEMPELGSVCSGGRYNDLTSLYSKQSYPGVGGSLGIDRLMVALKESEWSPDFEAVTSVCIINVSKDLLPSYIQLASRIRSLGLPCEVYPESTKLGAQFKYADKKGYTLALVYGESEKENNTVQFKEITSEERKQHSVPLKEIEDFLSNFSK